jgi:hypothetical protein
LKKFRKEFKKEFNKQTKRRLTPEEIFNFKMEKFLKQSEERLKDAFHKQQL